MSRMLQYPRLATKSDILILLYIVADADPQDPYVFGPPGSGSGSICTKDPDPSIIKQKSNKSLNSYCFMTSL
jgi:hypothetical protein